MTTPHIVRELEQRLEQRYEKDTDDKEYSDAEPEGWFICQYCNQKIYYSRKQPRELRKHEEECEGSSEFPQFEPEQREA